MEEKGLLQERFGALFKPEHPIMMGLSFVFDMGVLSLVVVLTSLPLFTMGASLVALSVCLFRRISGRGYDSVGAYFEAFKKNFAQPTAVWSVLMALGAGVFYVFKRGVVTPGVASVSLAAIGVLLAAGILNYLIPVLGRYENSLTQEVKLAAQMAVIFLPQTIKMLLCEASFGAFCWILPEKFGVLCFLLGIAPMGYLCARMYVPAMLNLEAKLAGEEQSAIEKGEGDGRISS